jgi:hypothetical protein
VNHIGTPVVSTYYYAGFRQVHVWAVGSNGCLYAH